MTREEIESGMAYARAALNARMRENDADGAANVALALLALDAARARLGVATNPPSPSSASVAAPTPAFAASPRDDDAQIINFEAAKRALAGRPRVCEPRGDARPLRRTALRLYRED